MLAQTMMVSGPTTRSIHIGLYFGDVDHVELNFRCFTVSVLTKPTSYTSYGDVHGFISIL